MKYSAQKIVAIRRQIEFYALDTPVGFWALSVKQLRLWCNGCGAEYFPRLLRDALSAFADRYAPAFAIHDVDYETGGDRAAADRRLLRNTWKIFRRDFGFWWWLNRAALLELFIIIVPSYLAVRLGGGKAWEDARQEGDASAWEHTNGSD